MVILSLLIFVASYLFPGNKCFRKKMDCGLAVGWVGCGSWDTRLSEKQEFVSSMHHALFFALALPVFTNLKKDEYCQGVRSSGRKSILSLIFGAL